MKSDVASKPCIVAHSRNSVANERTEPNMKQENTHIGTERWKHPCPVRNPEKTRGSYGPGHDPGTTPRVTSMDPGPIDGEEGV